MKKSEQLSLADWPQRESVLFATESVTILLESFPGTRHLIVVSLTNITTVPVAYVGRRKIWIRLIWF